MRFAGGATAQPRLPDPRLSQAPPSELAMLEEEYDKARRDQEGVVANFDSLVEAIGYENALQAVTQASESVQRAAVAVALAANPGA